MGVYSRKTPEVRRDSVLRLLIMRCHDRDSSESEETGRRPDVYQYLLDRNTQKFLTPLRRTCRRSSVVVRMEEELA